MANSLFGDTWYGIRKRAVIWYRDIRQSDDGSLYFATGLENDRFKLIGPNGNFKRQEIEGSNSTLFSNPTTTMTMTEPVIEPRNGIATVRGSTGALELYPTNNGNLFLAPIDTTEDLSLLTNDTVLNAVTLADNTDVSYLINSDSTDRLLHYFPDEISNFGASRLRFASWDKLPVGSHLVKDTSAAALQALETEGFKFVLIGGQASKCGPLALVATVVEALATATAIEATTKPTPAISRF
ncbi:hypothetical protein N0V88_000621 [Collariella sp. IMI 366227]|nr:hypothetical protein N0V88_000621 [Collariella sp. IMI 366227]